MQHEQVYVVGDVGIQEELDLHGYQHFGGPEDAGKVIELKPGYALPHDENVRPCSCPRVLHTCRKVEAFAISAQTVAILQNETFSGEFIEM